MLPLRDNIPARRAPVVTITLIALNVAAYFLWQRGGLTIGDPSSTHYLLNLSDYGAFPFEFTHPGDHCEIVNTAGAVQCAPADQLPSQPATWLTAFTAMFMHGGLLHLGGNMLFLWIFGNNVEDAMGYVKFTLFYVAGGLAALLLQILVSPGAQVPTIGASGAIAAVLGAYIVLYPRARVVTVIFIIFFFTILELPALLVLGLWFLQQAVFGALDLSQPGAGDTGGVAYFAHVGGFVFGLLAVRVLAKRPPPPVRSSWAR